MTPPWLLPTVALVLIFATMALEAARSAANERALRRQGAREVPDPDYPWMRFVYPGGFLAVCLEGWWRGVGWDALAAAGIATVERLGLDTYPAPDRFFSYRRATHRGEPSYGRQFSLVGLPGQAAG